MLFPFHFGSRARSVQCKGAGRKRRRGRRKFQTEVVRRHSFNDNIDIFVISGKLDNFHDNDAHVFDETAGEYTSQR